jgi:hypothetical protein
MSCPSVLKLGGEDRACLERFRVTTGSVNTIINMRMNERQGYLLIDGQNSYNPDSLVG